jgi:antirestriction protein ArdC
MTTTMSAREQKRHDAIQRQLELTARSVEQLRSTDGWQAWLKTRRAFRTYSLRNQLLIAVQRPDATIVCGFRKWLTLGYAVRKGETGLKIWAPMKPSQKKLQAWIDAGKPAGEKPDTFFKLVTVFDRAQVDAIPDQEQAPLEPDWPHLTTDLLAQYLPKLEDMAEANGAPVEYVTSDTLGSARGAVQLRKGTPIATRILDGLAPDETVATLLHELCHTLIRTQADTIHPPTPLNPRSEEVIVETATHAICQTLGLDTGPMTIPYLATWCDATPHQDLQKHAATIHNLANHIETGLNPT